MGIMVHFFLWGYAGFISSTVVNLGFTVPDWGTLTLNPETLKLHPQPEASHDADLEKTFVRPPSL